MTRRLVFGVLLAVGCGNAYSDETHATPVEAGVLDAAAPSIPVVEDAAAPANDPCVDVIDPVAMASCVDETHGFFVDPKTGVDGAPGTKAAPLRTIASALELVEGTTRNRIFLCEARYAERVKIETKAVMIWGGFVCGTWAYTGAKATISSTVGVLPTDAGVADAGSTAVAAGTATIEVRSVNDTVVLSDLLIDAAPKPTVAGGSNVALFAVDTSRVVIQRMFLLAGPGGDGSIGAVPPGISTTAPNGNEGSLNGGDGLGNANPLCPASIGGNGGALPVGTTLGKINGTAGKVSVATPRPPGANGAGGVGTVACANGGAGTAGSAGADGDGGGASAAVGVLEATGWVPAAGASGRPGADGQGGGGGARIYAAAGVGTGGGGGAGGCGSKGGGGGQGGGASIAIAALRTLVEIDASSTLTTAAAGTGGRGANAPSGQPGGGAGAGHTSRACAGGYGGAGGSGGGGSGGAGGVSVGVLYTGAAPRIAGKNVSDADQLPGQAILGTPGAPGAEGYSSSFTGFGKPGPKGIAKAVFAVP